ncbi:hypothetical protein [Thalassomonas actiniarum]|uniref:Uncharacterized protein n=1 Tax=Thalassomonas actiniarum TaxID=485447 RepID=A0AAF0C5R6_9GAMM|nr:hypothetical protein [Thalassomonas actiniarum]WDE01244.1 hypothetical protein SG35_011720 [Thalassomonas actiniarum]
MNKSVNTPSEQAAQTRQSSNPPERNTYKLSIYLAEIFAVLVFIMLVGLIANLLVFSQTGL